MDEIEQIRIAIEKAVIELKTQAELCRRAKIDKSNLHKFLIGKVKTMEINMFFRLYPHVRKFLPENFIAGSECEKICAGLDNAEKGFMKDFKDYNSEEKMKVWKVREDIKKERLKNRTADTLSSTAKPA